MKGLDPAGGQYPDFDVLFVGDPHVRVEDLLQASALRDLILSQAVPGRRLVILGDLFHNHSVVHLQVLHFWMEAVKLFTQVFKDVTLVMGNHDTTHDATLGIHALQGFAHIPGVTVVDRPMEFGPFLFVPFCRDNDQFVAACKASDRAVVICHQSMNGGKYENGIFIKDGVDPALITQKLILSGHIHAGQEFAQVWYPGNPRALTANDANQDRFIWKTTWTPLGELLTRESINTAGVLARIMVVDDREEAPLDPEQVKVFPCDQLTIVLHGSEEWIRGRRQVWSGRAKVKSVPLKTTPVRVKESEGLMPALRRYLGQLSNKDGVPGEVLFQEIARRASILTN